MVRGSARPSPKFSFITFKKTSYIGKRYMKLKKYFSKLNNEVGFQREINLIFFLL